MAEVLTEFASARGSYPWDTWTNGKVYRASKRVDFPCKIEGFVSSLRSYGRRHGFSVRVDVNAASERVTFKFTKLEMLKRKPRRKATGK